MSNTERIRVLLVDDHPVVRHGLVAMFTAFDDLMLVGEAASGEAAIQQCEAEPPDVVLMDLKMPGMGGIAATRTIRERWPKVQVLALTSFPDGELVHQAIAAGALSYLVKNIEPDELVAAIHRAAAGQPTLAYEATGALLRALHAPSPPGHDLTPRERDVLGLLVAGLQNAAIAARLDISRSAVKYHISNILAKLEVSSRAEAVALAVQHRLVE
jgi:NarL family two-component system response regulator LiaR